MSHTEHDLTKEKDQLWQAQQHAYERALLLTKKPLQEVFSEKEIAEAFSQTITLFIGCMDERVPCPPGMKKIGIGGSGALLTDAQLELFVSSLKELGFTIGFVSDHDGCGACKLYCQQHDLPPEQAPAVAKDTAHKVAMKIGVSEQHIGFDQMEGHADIHHARAITIDCCGNFRPNQLGLPSTFELTDAVYPDSAQLEAELNVAVSIALGDHGMGAKRFDVTQGGEPLLLILVENPKNPERTAAINKIVDKVAANYPNAIKVIRLQAPASAK